jgi:hypothetical protein
LADDPQAFARRIERLLTDESLWQRISSEGKAHIDRLNGREISRQRFLEVIELVRSRPLKPPPPAGFGSIRQLGLDEYEQLISRIGTKIRAAVPSGAHILVVSKGDDRLVALDGYVAGHFPQADGGGYAGHHPGSGLEALEHLQRLHTQGNEYLVFPSTSFWWLDHYSELRQHLEARCQCLASDANCRLYRLGSVSAATRGANNGASSAIDRDHPPIENRNGLPAAALNLGESREPNVISAATAAARQIAVLEFVDKVRPVIPVRARERRAAGGASRRRILVYGVYLANQPNTVEHVVAALDGSQRHEITQRWTALFGEPPTSRVANVTVGQVVEKTPKFEILNELLAAEDVGKYDYVLLTDDDIVVPEEFLDAFIGLQEELAFAIAQPARTSNSYIDHPIVEQQQGVLARRTMFVEVGPVVSFHRSCFDLVFPFDLTSPMGWGYENVWSRRLAERGLKMGIIDAVPVDHSLRKPVENYSWAEANRQRKAYLAKVEHYPHDQCLRVLEVAGFPDSNQGAVHEPRPAQVP